MIFVEDLETVKYPASISCLCHKRLTVIFEGTSQNKLCVLASMLILDFFLRPNITLYNSKKFIVLAINKDDLKC